MIYYFNIKYVYIYKILLMYLWLLTICKTKKSMICMQIMLNPCIFLGLQSKLIYPKSDSNILGGWEFI